MTIADAKLIHSACAAERWQAAGSDVLKLLGSKQTCDTPAQGIKLCQQLFQYLLDNDLYLEAATLQWGSEMFNTEPESTVRVFNALSSSSKVLLQGASSMSKTYAAGAYYVLDWMRDPWYTSVKLAAINEDHLKKNLFAHVVALFRACSIPFPQKVVIQDSALWMGIKEAGNEFGISGIAFKQSQETSGQFKGYKAKPARKKRHVRFGHMTRLRVLLDEAQNVPGGPFKDFNSLVASITGTDLIKVACSYNPESQSQHVVQLAAPEQGWRIEELDSLYDWMSKAGWRVCRLDAARCENVIQRKVVYPGLQTYDGYLGYLKAGGDNSPNYMTFARGFPPVTSTADVIIPPSWPQEARGEATFIEAPIDFAGVDLAFMGKDSAVMAVGRWGLASGYRDYMGKFHKFMDRTNITQEKPRHVLQVDQLLPLAKHDNTPTMAEEIMGKCRNLGIKPENVGVDSTGYGFGVHGHLNKVWGTCLGVAWNEKATERKILAEDLQGADKQCDGVMSEMWWAFRQWLAPSCKAILLNPIIPMQPLHTQLTSRRYRPSTPKGVKVEKKEEYMARNANHSPDESDALMVLLHTVRNRSEVIPGTVEHQLPGKESNEKTKISWQSVKQLVSVSESSDAIGPDGEDEY